MWTPWGPSEVSCIKRCPHFRGRFTYISAKHIWDTQSVHDYTEVSLFQVQIYIKKLFET